MRQRATALAENVDLARNGKKFLCCAVGYLCFFEEAFVINRRQFVLCFREQCRLIEDCRNRLFRSDLPSADVLLNLRRNHNKFCLLRFISGHNDVSSHFFISLLDGLRVISSTHLPLI